MNTIQKAKEHLEAQLPFVIYRKPNEEEITGFFQRNDTLFATENFETSGFVFAPFDTHKPAYIFPTSHCDVEVSMFEPPRSRSNATVTTTSPSDAEIAHKKLVEKAIAELQSDDFKKVVLSREERVSVGEFDALASFLRMCGLYKNAFVYLWYHPKEGMWTGATPETLLQLDGERFSTVALASTQKYEGSTDVFWGKKEQEEHQFVVDYILMALGAIRKSVKEVSVSETYTAKAGNLLHLCANINGVLRNSHLKELITALHPTPAVCGLPKEKAKQFITKNEAYDRGFYTGFLGELGQDAKAHLFVNLRCMKFYNQTLHIFVGGGITAASNAQLEWEETVAKTQTMRGVL